MFHNRTVQSNLVPAHGQTQKDGQDGREGGLREDVVPLADQVGWQVRSVATPVLDVGDQSAAGSHQPTQRHGEGQMDTVFKIYER